MTSSDDPFEMAARREHADQLRREARIAAVRGSSGRAGGPPQVPVNYLGDSGVGGGMLSAIVVFLGPYLVWAALRAGDYAWSTPTVGRSVGNFFFGSGVPFAVYTAWLLFLVWIWAMTLTGRRGGGGTLSTIVVFLGPYLVWAALRAEGFAWSTPSAGQSVVRFFFGSGIAFAVYTGWLLFLVWIWAITFAGRHKAPKARHR